jgi:hypothetical protein
MRARMTLMLRWRMQMAMATAVCDVPARASSFPSCGKPWKQPLIAAPNSRPMCMAYITV